MIECCDFPDRFNLTMCVVLKDDLGKIESTSIFTDLYLTGSICTYPLNRFSFRLTNSQLSLWWNPMFDGSITSEAGCRPITQIEPQQTGSSSAKHQSETSAPPQAHFNWKHLVQDQLFPCNSWNQEHVYFYLCDLSNPAACRQVLPQTMEILIPSKYEKHT